MLTINAPVFDLQGSVVVPNPVPAGLSAFSRRVSRSATLDGGAAISDFGYSPADRTLNIEWTARSQAEVDNVRRLVQSYGRLIVSFHEGCFTGAPESFAHEDGDIRVSLLIERKLSS